LVSMQMELPMDPRYSTDSAKVLAEAPHLLKESFHKLLDEKHETNETKQIIDSLVDNTVPKDYDAQLKSYDKNLQLALAQLRTVQSTAETEALKYEDPLRSLEAEKENLAGTEMSATKLSKLGKTLDSLATQARFLPVGDVRAAVGLYSLTLVANGMGQFRDAETFAQQSINHVNAMADNMPVVPRIQIALAYALAKQGKNDEFKTLRDTMLKTAGDQESTLVTLARLTENTADYPGAVAIYKQALDIRTKHGTTRPPEWMDSYNELLKRISTQ